jgi:hypothetical protein
MSVQLLTKIYWEDRDVASLVARLSNGNRQISIAMASTPGKEALGRIGTRVICDDPTIMLVLTDAPGGHVDVTQAVLGGGDEHYASDDLLRAMKWLMEGV